MECARIVRPRNVGVEAVIIEAVLAAGSFPRFKDFLDCQLNPADFGIFLLVAYNVWTKRPERKFRRLACFDF